MAAVDASTTVDELAAFVDRAQKALAEKGRVDLVPDLCVIVRADGRISLVTHPEGSGVRDADALKAVDIDPVFEAVE